MGHNGFNGKNDIFKMKFLVFDQFIQKNNLYLLKMTLIEHECMK